MEIEIDLGNLRTIEDALRRAPAMAIREMEAAAEEAGGLLQREVQDAYKEERSPDGKSGVGVTGALKGSITHEVRVGTLGVEAVVGSAQKHLVYVEIGTRPHYVSVNKLIDWVKVKFSLSSDKAALGVAYAIKANIAKRGTPGQYQFRDTLNANEAQVRAIFARAVARIGAALGSAG